MCPFKPEEYLGQPIGMFHCPLCLEMVVAGLPHPDYSLLDDFEDDLASKQFDPIEIPLWEVLEEDEKTNP